MTIDAHDVASSSAFAAPLAEFRKQPTAATFVTLRNKMRSAGDGEALVHLCELWAPRESDPKQAVEIWSEGGEVLLALGQTARALRFLQRALDLDPTHARTVDAATSYLLSQNNIAAAVEAIERELTELARRADADKSKKHPNLIERRAEQHRKAAMLWNDQLGRVDRALYHWQLAWRLEPQRTDALGHARALYASLGDTAMVAKLFQAELDVLPKDAPAATRAHLRYELGKLAWQARDLAAAQRHLEEAARLDTSAIATRELLVEVYAAPQSNLAEGPARAAAILTDLGLAYHQSGELDTAIRYLRRATGLAPGQAAPHEALARALTDAARWDELDALLAVRSEQSADELARANVLSQRAELLRGPLAQTPQRDASAMSKLLRDLAMVQQPYGKAATELRSLLRNNEQWAELASFIEQQLAAAGNTIKASTAVADLLELATIAREHQGDRDRAAQLLHHALSIDPTHEEALARYVDHFRERRDWRGLCDLYEFALDNAREAGAPVDELERRLEEIAQLAELRMGDIARAIDAWDRIAELVPANPKVSEALRRLRARSKMWEELVVNLEADVAAAPDGEVRTNALRRMAQTYRERQIEPRRAIDAYEQLLREQPGDSATLKILAELYEREGDDAGLALTLRRQLDAEEAAMQTPGLPSSPRDWPVPKRTERLHALRRLANLYDSRLSDVEGVVYACSAVMELLPGDRESLERMERVLERAGDTRLEQTLEYHVSATQNPAERARLCKRLALLAQARNDDTTALERWEKALASSPADLEALTALADLYERTQRWNELADVLARLEGNRPLPAPGSEAAAVRTAELLRLAIVQDEHLRDAAKAMATYARVLEVSPRHRGALAALAELYRRDSRWRELAGILARQVETFATTDPDAAADIAREQAALYESKLGAPQEAIRVLEALIGEIAPHDGRAHTVLRRLYEARGNYDAAVRAAERELYLSQDPPQKIALGLEIASVCRTRLNDPMRALQAYERVLAIDPAHSDALRSCAEILGQLGRHKDELRAIEKYLQTVTDVRERREWQGRIAHVYASELNEPRTALRWLRKAHEEAPDSHTLHALRRAAEQHALWREYADFLADERKRLLPTATTDASGDLHVYIALSSEAARIWERQLGDRTRAMTLLAEALQHNRRDRALLAELERLAHQTDARPAYKQLLDAYDVALDAANAAEKLDLHLRKARLLEEKLAEPRTAMAELLAAFSWAPNRDEGRTALYALAPKARAWPELIGVENSLIERAGTDASRIASLRRKATVAEEQLKDAPRAFRAHLVAFLIDPQDTDTTAALWRLAKIIGRYRDADKVPKADSAHATIQSEQALAHAHAEAERWERRQAARVEVGLDTEELPVTEMTDDALLEVGDSTQPIDIEELEMQAGRRTKPTLASPLRPPARISAPPPLPMGRATSAPIHMASSAASGGVPRALPPLPTSGAVSTAHKKGQAMARRTPLPALPNRSFDSPWEEFAYAYEQLPALDAKQKLRWLYAAAEVWEGGAKDIARAFDTLAAAFVLARKQPSDDGEAKARLHRVANDHRAWDRLGDFYQALAESASTPAAIAELLMEVAAIRLNQRRARDAETQLRRILGIAPEHAVARAKLETLYRQENRWVELAAALEERTDPRLGSAAPLAERPALLLELAAIYKDRLHRPLDAVEAMERHRALVPHDLALAERLAEEYSNLGRWSKAIENLHRVVELAAGSPTGRQAQAHIADIYVKQLELPERALDAYNDLVAQWPDDAAAWEALDRIYQAHARWVDLTEVLRRRAGLARDSAERARLLARRAQIQLDWLGAPDEAVAALRHAKSVAEDEATHDWLSDQLIVALTRAGRDREAAAILENRLTQPGVAQMAAGDTAALHLRLAQIRAEKLRDPLGARASVDAALTLVPEHPTALAIAATLAAGGDNPRALVEAKLRQAEGTIDEHARVAALMAAGEVARDQLKDAALARTCFERVLAVRAYHADATWALAGLVEQGGDPDAAARLLATRLEDQALHHEERARLLTQLAALSRAAGVDPAAERHLLEALSTVPGHVPAIVALADLYADTERWATLEAFLRDILSEEHQPGRLAQAPAALVAELHRRLAFAFEKLNRDEDAYQTLLTADRLARGHLLIKLALGENRYKARRWREAALHLAPLGQHEEAAKYASDVAQGLYHAALAEVRSLRPERAQQLYQRALELRPDFGPALQALAEIAMEQGDSKRAADLLERQAQATADSVERLRLFEALGDMALMMLSDEDRARTCYAAAVQAAQPLEARHVPLLEKLLERQDLAGDFAGSARTAELMAAFGATPAARAARLVRAARDYATAEDWPRARAAAERALTAEPNDIDAADVASDAALRAGDTDAATALLGRVLNAKDEHNPPLRAKLWYRLGAARAARGDNKQARAALERAITLAPQSEGAVAARRALSQLLTQLPGTENPLTHLRALVAQTGEAYDAHALAQELLRQHETSEADLVFELLSAAGFAVEARAATAPAAMLPDAAYRGTVDDSARRMLADPELATLAPIISTLAEAASLLWPDVEENLARMGVGDAEKLAASTGSPAHMVFAKVAQALGTGAALLYQSPSAPRDVVTVCAATPIVVLHPRVVRADMPLAEVRALMARAAEFTRLEHLPAAGLPPAVLERVLGAVLRLFGPPSLRESLPWLGADAESTRPFDESVKGALSVKLRARLEQFLKNMPAAAFQLANYTAAVERTADRAALLVGGSPHYLMQTARAASSTNHLFALIGHANWAPTRRALLP